MSDDLKADLAKFLMEGDVFWPEGFDDTIAAASLHSLGLVEFINDDARWHVGCRVTEAGKRYIVGGD